MICKYYECKNIVEIISLAKEPPLIDYETFEKDTKYNATLYVPVGTTDKYKEATGWKEFVWIEEGVPSGIMGTKVKERKSSIRHYTLDGIETSSKKKGINIIKTKDGTTKKVLIK